MKNKSFRIIALSSLIISVFSGNALAHRENDYLNKNLYFSNNVSTVSRFKEMSCDPSRIKVASRDIRSFSAPGPHRCIPCALPIARRRCPDKNRSNPRQERSLSYPASSARRPSLFHPSLPALTGSGCAIPTFRSMRADAPNRADANCASRGSRPCSTATGIPGSMTN